MTGYLGTPARMIPSIPAAAQREVSLSRYVVQSAARRRWAFDLGAHRPRAWDVDLALMTTSEQRALSEVEAWGPGPWWWVSCAAHDSNVLTPRQSLLDGLSGGPADGVEGWSPVSHLGPTRVALAAGVPVIPGKPVTVSLEASGSATLFVALRNGAGALIRQYAEATTGSLMQRLTVTVPTVGATARTVDVEVSGHVRALRPQVTWTASPHPWTAGRGASQVVVQNSSVDLLAHTRSGTYWDGTVQLLEVG